MYTILVIDDEPKMADILQRFLIKSGFKVMVALGGEEGMGVLCSAVKVDLITLDMKMPGVTGINVLRGMRGLNRKTPAIILTGSINLDYFLFTELQEVGLTREDILYKPVDLFVFLTLIKKRLGI
ncbi:MAG: response regulator [Candidatus Omnitrophica bacterium]|nr:response regulator [Candidatus Omnitrophota bacterium]